MSHGYVPQYATDDQDFSESDCPSESHLVQHLTSDFTELYRGKQQALNHSRNSGGNYYHTHMPGYYEQHTRLPTTCTCNLPPDPRYCYYKGVPVSQEAVLRTPPQISPNLRTCPDTKPTSTATVKKYPITARTPRYIRHPGAQLCKRPSTLCLPVTCQPDPAVFHRPRKASTEIQHYRGQEASYAINDYVMSRTTAVKRTDTRPVDSEGDVNSRLNDLETLLTKFDDDDDEGGENEQVEISGVSDIAKILKPKVPASVKAKQDKVLKLRAVKTNLTETIAATGKVNTLDVKEAPPNLEILLQRFHNESPKTNDRGDTKEKKEAPKPRPKADVDGGRMKHSIFSEQKPPLDDTSALELHKSKSYIVSLIDKALSKELGTIPGDKCTTQEFLNMNPKKAVELVNRHSFHTDFENMVNFEQLSVAQPSCSKKDTQCVCQKDEPTYLKQLKQLRWSHLRHIQREAKRLADLERFLDSFSETDSTP